MYATVPHVYESRVIPKPVDKIWGVIRRLDFRYSRYVEKAEVEGADSEGIFLKFNL